MTRLISQQHDAANTPYIDENKGLLSRSLVMVLGLLSAIAALSTDMYLPLFPAIAEALATRPINVQLSLTAFMGGLAIGQLIIGPCSDRYGRRKLLLGGTTLLTAASLACALAPDINILITARFFQGLGGAAGIVLTRAIIADLCPGDRAAHYFNLVLAIQGIAPIVAPLIGGVATYFPWPLVFVFMASIALLTTLLSYGFIHESLPLKQRITSNADGFITQFFSLMGNKPYLGYTLIFATQFGALFAYISASPFIYQSLFAFSAHEFSLIFAINAAIMMLSSIVSARYVMKFGAKRLMRLGVFGTLTISLLLFATGFTPRFQCEITIVLLFAMMFTQAFVFGNAASLALSATSHLRGTGSAVMGALQFGAAAVTPPLVGLGRSMSLIPMALVIMGCCLLSLLALLLTAKKGVCDE